MKNKRLIIVLLLIIICLSLALIGVLNRNSKNEIKDDNSSTEVNNYSEGIINIDAISLCNNNKEKIKDSIKLFLKYPYDYYGFEYNEEKAISEDLDRRFSCNSYSENMTVEDSFVLNYQEVVNYFSNSSLNSWIKEIPDTIKNNSIFYFDQQGENTYIVYVLDTSSLDVIGLSLGEYKWYTKEEYVYGEEALKFAQKIVDKEKLYNELVTSNEKGLYFYSESLYKENEKYILKVKEYFATDTVDDEYLKTAKILKVFEIDFKTKTYKEISE